LGKILWLEITNSILPYSNPWLKIVLLISMSLTAHIPPLQKGDLIFITAPAKSIDSSYVHYAENYLLNQGYRVEISAHCLGEYHYFSGSEAQRALDFNSAIHNPEVKAILCARGGYGCIQVLDQIDWHAFSENPKWIIGFSDVTVFHHRLQHLGFPSIHGNMPLNFEENSKEALDTLIAALEGASYSIGAPAHSKNVSGDTEGIVVGGNLSIIYSLLGTKDKTRFDGGILFIEDLAEQRYHLDRMLHSLIRSGAAQGLKGLIVGSFTGMQDTAVPYGKDIEEIIIEHFGGLNIPIAFGFPAGHIPDNRAMVFGDKARFTVGESGALLSFRND
jgi:muramoyltetrapeptide carboxypeptidase